MKELAPQTADGSYSRPSYDFQARIGDANFPVTFHHQRWLAVLDCTLGWYLMAIALMLVLLAFMLAGRVWPVSHLHWQCLPMVSPRIASTDCEGSHPAYQCHMGS